jgi:hypothetical protein
MENGDSVSRTTALELGAGPVKLTPAALGSCMD